VRAWYNGYLFGGEVIYNPWSVLCYLDSSDTEGRPYWLSTSSNDLVRELLERYAFELQPVFEVLLEGGSIERSLDENVVLERARQSEDALWSLLVFSGYLKAEEAPDDALGRAVHRLSIPNREVREVYSSTFPHWMKRRVEGHGGRLADLTEALLTGDAEVFEEQLQAFVTNVLSYHDPGKLHPERVYHGFLVGLLAVLEPGHQVRSNRESGKGRSRRDDPAHCGRRARCRARAEGGAAGKKTLDQALAEGSRSSRPNDYAAELRAAGARRCTRSRWRSTAKRCASGQRARADRTATTRTSPWQVRGLP
jgi:hypothetical protein